MTLASPPPLKTSVRPARPLAKRIPALHQGDRLTGEEFDRRYAAMPSTFWAELIEGVVYMTPPVFEVGHGSPHSDLIGWMAQYRAATPGVIASDNTSLRLDPFNRPQPDVYLRVLESHGGRSRVAPDGYIDGPPDLIAEVAASTANHDLHGKLDAYLRNGVREYIAWRTYDRAIDWFALRGGRYVRLRPSPTGVYQSRVFPGLWLDAAALLRGDLAAVLRIAQQGTAGPAHAAFVEKLRKAAEQKPAGRPKQ